MKLDVVTLDAGAAGSIDLPDDIFGIEDIRDLIEDLEQALAAA